MTPQEELEYQEEYETRVKYWKVDYRGKMWIPTNMNFHPNLFKGTEKELDKICREHLFCHEDEFKVVGIHSFNTYEEYNERFGIVKQ